MNNIRVKQESLNDWRSELKESTNCECEGCDCNPCVECGEDCHNLNEEIEGGINVQNVADGLNFTEIETVDIIKPEPIKGASNWQLEMAVESLISEGYNDDEIATILTEGIDDVGGPLSIGGVLSGIARATKFTYNLGKGARGVVNRGIRDTKLTKDILDTAKKLRQPKLSQGVDVVKKGAEKGGGIARSFKGFMQNVKNSAKKIRNSSKQEIQTTAKDVDVLGGAATNPATKVKDMKNITPSPIGDGIKKVANQIKGGASAAAVTGGVVAGSNLTSNSPSKVATGTELKADKPLSASIRGDQKKNVSSVEKKVEAPITNDGKKTVDPSKNEKIDTPPTKRELRNKRNDSLSSKEGKRARRDARLQKKKDSGFPSKRMKSGTPVNQLFNKEEITNEGIVDTVKNFLKLGKNPKTHKVSDETPMGKAVTGLQKRSEANKKAMELLNQSYSWRDELGFDEGNRTRYKGVGLSGSGNKKDLSKGPNEKVFVDYTKIRANAPVKTDTKVG